MGRTPRTAWRHYSLAVAGYYGLLAPLTGDAETFGDLPPPPTIIPGQPRQHLLLALTINEAERGGIVPVGYQDGHYFIRSADLALAGLPTDRLSAVETDISAMPEVTVAYDSRRKRLKLTVPPAWLPGQYFTGSPDGERYPAHASTGALLNYDIYASRIDNGAPRLSAWNEWRAFGEAGHVSTDGVLQQPLSDTGNRYGRYLRYDTYWGNEDEERSLSWRGGDTVTHALTWSSSVRIGGIRIARDFTVRPDIVTYPLPSFAGQAAVPTAVDLFVNGYRTGYDVQPGPYSFTNLPFINGAGEAVVVTTDALGRRVATTQPFYVSSSLLKPGLPDYSFSTGAIRRAYGLRNFDYGTFVASGSYRQGITDGMTLEAHGEGARSLALAGMGGLFKLGRWGVVNSAVTRSRLYGDNGNQYDWGYQYNNRDIGLGIRNTVRDEGFGNLSTLDSGAHPVSAALRTLSRRSAQYYASLSMDRYGSLGATFIGIRSAAGKTTRLWNLSWSKTLWADSSLFISTTYDTQEKDYTGAVSLLIPFGSLTSASLGLERDRPGGIARRLQISRAMPSDGGFSWDLSYASQRRQGDYRQATLDWRNPYLETSGGFYGRGDNGTAWGDVSGALVLMDRQLLPANQLSNAFALVKTDYPEVPVHYENQLIGSTDGKGYLLIPGISAYYPAKYDIDTLALPLDLSVEKVEQRVAVRRRSGYMLHFPIEPLRAANVILHDGQGQPLPVGTRLYRDGRQIDYVGWDGIAWLDHLTLENPLHGVAPDGRQCRTRLILPGGKPAPFQTYGPLICPLSAQP